MDGRLIHLFFLFAAMWMALSETITLFVSPPDSVQLGQTATLPCWLSPSQNAEDLEVHWYRQDNHHRDIQVMLYKEKRFDNGAQESSYVGRVSFGSKDASSRGLKTGDVSLKLTNVTLEDEGVYVCYVTSVNSHDRADVHLKVRETGSPPLLSIMWNEDNLLNVSCESEGWYPQPRLHWLDKTNDLTPGNVTYSKVSSGLISVHSWLIVPSSSEVSCSVGLPDEELQEAKLHIKELKLSAQKDSRSSPEGWVAFGILLIIVIAAFGAVYYKIKVKKPKMGRDEADGIRRTDSNDENKRLLPKGHVQAIACKYYVNVKPEDTSNRFIKIVNTIVREASDYPDGDKVTCLTALKGTPGFSCGQHYWEVSLEKANVGLKKSWWIGVTSVTEIPQDPNFSPNASNGFWFLSSSANVEHALQLSTNPTVLLPAHSSPRTVGVYLDFDKQELSFYDVENERLIGSLTTSFSGQVFPFFNPGKGDISPMEILQRPEPSSGIKMEEVGNADV